MDWKQETEPALQEIRRLLREAGISQRQLEERVGFSRGYVSQLLARNLDLKVWHVLAILNALEHSPGEFFSRMYPAAKKRRRALEEFQRASGPLTEEVDEVLGRLYKYGVESLNQLRDRLARCEQSVARIEASGILDEYRRRRKRKG